MLAFLLRAILLLIVIGLIALAIPRSRRWLWDKLRSRDVVAFKQTLATALIIYFLLSLVLTLRDCSRFA